MANLLEITGDDIAKLDDSALRDLIGLLCEVDMLKTLVPSGRTHRLSVLVAGMLQYALEVADDDPEEGSVAASLMAATETGDPEEIEPLLGDVIARLFKDAGMEFKRVSKRGEPYSIAEEACREFATWFDYPWD